MKHFPIDFHTAAAGRTCRTLSALLLLAVAPLASAGEEVPGSAARLIQSPAAATADRHIERLPCEDCGLDAAQWQQIQAQIVDDVEAEFAAVRSVSARGVGADDSHGLVRTGVVVGIYDGLPTQSGNPGPEFGYSVAVDGDWLAVGAPGTLFNDSGIRAVGAVFLFRRLDGHWQAIYRISGNKTLGVAPNCGYSVALKLPYLMVGCPGAGHTDNPDGEHGIARTYRTHDGSTWLFDAGWIHAGAGSRCGTSVALSSTGQSSGNALAVTGCPGWTQEQGRVLVREYVGATEAWSSATQVLASNGAIGDRFGTSVAVHRAEGLGITTRRLAVGAPYKTHGPALAAGSAYVFEGGTWNEVANLTGPNPSQFAITYFGAAVAVTGNQLVVGAPGGLTSGCANVPRCGTVRRYQRNSGQWQAQEGGGAINAGGNPAGEQAGMQFGAAVAIGFDSLIAVAAPRAHGWTQFSGQAEQVGMVELRRNGNAVHGVATSDHRGELQPGPIGALAHSHGGFGTSLAFGGRRLVVGYPHSGSQLTGRRGAVWIYEEDGLFSDDFDGPDIVQFRNVNHFLVNSIQGTSINWTTGQIVNSDPSSGYDINLYSTGGVLGVWWNLSPAGNAGRAPSISSSNYNVLTAGTVLGPGTPSGNWSRTNGGMPSWHADTAGYLGFRFDCSTLPTAPANGLCYGYVHLQTSAPNGYPALLRGWAYNRRGHAITTVSLIDP